MSFKKLFLSNLSSQMRESLFHLCIVIFLLFTFSSEIFSRTIEVHEGESIQKVIDSLEKGDTVKVFPGVYHEFLFVDKTHFTLSGVIVNGKWPVLDGLGKLNDGVIGSGANFLIENFHIKNYKANGVMTQGAGNITMRKLIVENTGIYGIYPTMGTNVLIEDTVSLGIADAAIYIGMCHNVDVRRNEVYGSVIGIEIENSTNVLIEGNTVYDNSAGIVAFALPGLPLKKVENVIIRKNFIFDNNHRNFAEPGALVAGVPPGIGIGVMAGDEVTIEGNIIRRNSFAGIGIGDNNLLPNSKSPDPDVEPNPDRNKILENVFIDNGVRKWNDLVSWIFYVIRIIFSGNPIPESPNGGKVGIFPDGYDVVASGKGKDNCLISPDSVTKIGTKDFGVCDTKDTSEKIKTMIGDPKQGETKSDARELGKQVFGAVCSGCHSMNIRTVGPPIKEIQEKYKKDVYGVVSFASMPKKVREGFIEMPSQKYLGNEKLTAVANYILNLKDEGNKGVTK
ncbi:hypothetical protein EHQ68_11255 [Leptospira congkakensis]|uniref:Cytochrome c domain-containing protein n=1 Tax=Leptospira congkakensis TaxID=2484932 RepID=A0A4Z1A4B6_9LEPT|nr:parallel beta-helix domain-containing protein [Leptospira congkakensis]TGL87130.1 hypothetical protein EHQ68_11255 [Leptospira congkakensis]TGL96698.1 hypothetical protein EHQ69_00200 [Leptospira congkakensis]TGL97547.1 hypothetical protein EHQ70_05855 [Leptospira congkakensis]